MQELSKTRCDQYFQKHGNLHELSNSFQQCYQLIKIVNKLRQTSLSFMVLLEHEGSPRHAIIETLVFEYSEPRSHEGVAIKKIQT